MPAVEATPKTEAVEEHVPETAMLPLLVGKEPAGTRTQLEEPVTGAKVPVRQGLQAAEPSIE